MTLHTPNAPVPAGTQWNVRQRTRQAAMPPLTQRLQITWLSPSGSVEDTTRMVPAMPLFSRATSAFARGGIVPTLDGPVAVEDLIPGDRVITSQGPMPLLWKGAGTVTRSGGTFYRVPADALGPSRPMPDLVLGAAARIVSGAAGSDAALVPISSMTDHMSVIEITPISAMQSFHLAFERHLTFEVNGVEVESHHPGRLDTRIAPDALSLYASLFPHLPVPGDFGPLCLPRRDALDEPRRDRA